MITKDIYMNSWAVRVVGDDNMAQKVAQENGFIYKGKVNVSNHSFISHAKGGLKGFLKFDYFT